MSTIIYCNWHTRQIWGQVRTWRGSYLSVISITTLYKKKGAFSLYSNVKIILVNLFTPGSGGGVKRGCGCWDKRMSEGKDAGKDNESKQESVSSWGQMILCLCKALCMLCMLSSSSSTRILHFKYFLLFIDRAGIQRIQRREKKTSQSLM